MNTEVMNHLRSFCVLESNVISFDHGLHEMLVNELAEGPPQRSILHDKEVVALGHQVM